MVTVVANRMQGVMLLTVSECCGVGGDRLALSARLCQSTWLDGGHDQCQGWWCAPYTHPLCHARWQSSVNQHAPHTHQDAQGVARQASAMKMNRVSCGDFLAVVHNMVHSATLRPCLPTASVVDAHATPPQLCQARSMQDNKSLSLQNPDGEGLHDVSG